MIHLPFGGKLVTVSIIANVIAPLLEQNDCHFAQSKGFRAVPKIGI
jgi:hypothetical protein